MIECDNMHAATRNLRTSSAPSDTEPMRRAWCAHRGLSVSGLSLFLLCFILVASPLNAGNNPTVRIIFVNSQSEADSLLDEIKKGASFALLAKERSVDEKSRDRYGEIDAAAFERLEKPLKEAALRLRDGEFSGVIALRDNRHAIILAVDMTYYLKGTRAFRSKDFKTAEKNFLKHIELNPDAVKTRIRLGQIQETAKELNMAEASYSDALRFDPRCEEAYQRLGELYLSKGQFQRAQDLFGKGLQHIPDSKSLKAGIEKTKVRISRNRSGPLGDENPKGVTADSKIAKVEIPQDITADSNVAKIEIPQGVTADSTVAKVEIPEGVTADSKIAKIEIPQGVTADSNVAKVEIPEGDKPRSDMPKDAAAKGEASRTGISKSELNKKIHVRIIITDSESDAADILLELKKGNSFALLASERSIDENTRQAYGYLGEVGVSSLNASLLESSLELKEGETSGIVRMGPDRYALIQITNMSLFREGEKAFIARDFLTAEKKLLQYVESNPDAVKAHTIIGKIYEDRKEFSKAIEMYKKAISFSPQTVLVYERLARVYLFLGEYQKARGVYMEGLRQTPSSHVLEEGIEMADILLIGDGTRMP
jgi:tetratricopeptide (TPR) repeat protein